MILTNSKKSQIQRLGCLPTECFRGGWIHLLPSASFLRNGNYDNRLICNILGLHCSVEKANCSISQQSAGLKSNKK